MSRESLVKHVGQFQSVIRDANSAFWNDEIKGWAEKLAQFFDSREPYDTFGLLDYYYILVKEAIISLGKYSFFCDEQAELYAKRVAKMLLMLSQSLSQGDAEADANSIYKQVLANGLKPKLNRVSYKSLATIEATLQKELNFIITNGHNTYSKSLSLPLQSALDRLVNRSKSIATTVGTSVISTIDQEVYKTSGDVTYKMWVAMLDEKTRATHAEVSDSVIPLNDYFDVGGSLMLYPGDPDGPAEEVINCRCWTAPVYRGSLGSEADIDKWLNELDGTLVEFL